MRRFLLAIALLCGLAGAAHAQGTLSIYGDYPNITVTGTLSETILASVPIPANSMGPNGLARLTYTFTNNNSANTKTVTVRTSLTPGVTGVVTVGLNVTTNVSSQSVIFYRNHNSTSLNGMYNAPGQPFGTTGNPAENNPNIDSTQTIYLNITTTLTNVADSLTLNGWTLEITHQ